MSSSLEKVLKEIGLQLNLKHRKEWVLDCGEGAG